MTYAQPTTSPDQNGVVTFEYHESAASNIHLFWIRVALVATITITIFVVIAVVRRIRKSN
jgi:hypothetical protein